MSFLHSLFSRDISSKKIETIFNAIPQDVKSLIWSIDQGSFNYVSPNLDEPSAISSTYPIFKGKTEDLGYYPSYTSMTPKQRLTYLNWLCNIDEEIPIGYVFTYFYGLERHIHNGNVLPAVEMINRLKKYHSNKSFDYYSNNAIVYGALKSKNPELLKYIDLEKADSAITFLASGYLKHKISAEQIMLSAKKIGWTNLRYIKKCPTLFLANLKKILKESTGYEYFSLNKNFFTPHYSLKIIKLANLSLGKNMSIPDFVVTDAIQKPLLNALERAHSYTKKDMALARKNKSINKYEKTEYVSPNTKYIKNKSIFISTKDVDKDVRLGHEYEENNDYDNALLAYNSAFELAKEAKDPTIPPHIFMRQAIIYRKLKRYDKEVDIIKIGIRFGTSQTKTTTNKLKLRLSKAEALLNKK